MLPSSSLPTAPSFTLVVRFCDSLRRQAPPGCREGPIYLSGRRQAEPRRHQDEEKKLASVYRPLKTEVGLEQMFHRQPSLPMCVCTSVLVHDGFKLTAADHLAI
jgi:hypothetical protein